MVKVLWFSPYEILKAQEEELKRIYGENVEIEKVNRRFESKEHFLRYVKESGANVVYAPLSPDVLQEFKNTEIGKDITWLMCEWGEVKDGVRKEEEQGFNPESDYVRYAYNIGLHRRFLGFKEFLGYDLKARELTKIKDIEEKREFLPRDEYREKWKNIYRELNKEYMENKVYLKVRGEYINVKINKDCQMNDELRPLLKDLGFKFNRDYKEWYLKLDERSENIINTIRERVKSGVENITVRVLQKYKEPEWKARDVMKRLGGFTKIYREFFSTPSLKKRGYQRKEEIKEFLNKTPADIEEETAKEYEKYYSRIEPLEKKLEKLSKEYREAPLRSKERKKIKKEIGEIKKEIEKISNEYQNTAFEKSLKLREEIGRRLKERYRCKDEEYSTIDRVIDDLFISMSDNAYLERTWNMKIGDILNEIVEEYQREGELVPKEMNVEQREEIEVGA